MRDIYNRSIQIGTVVFILALICGVYFFLASLPPPPTTPYNIATLFYLDGNYPEALKILRPLSKEEPDNEEVQHLYGRALLKNKENRGAEALFTRMVEQYPDSDDMKLGLAEASLANDHFEMALPLYEQLARDNPGNEGVYLLLGNAYFKAGDNIRAARIYRYMIEEGMKEEEAEKQFLAIYGLPTYDPKMELGLNEQPQKPKNTQLNFRTNKDFIEARKHEGWEPVFLKGLNLSAAAPGYYVSQPPTEYEIYAEWLKTIADMNCNTVRLYTLCAPAFYQALKDHNEHSEKKLWLFQEVWLHVRNPRFQIEKEAFDLYDPSWQEEFRTAIVEVVDVLHGHANIEKRRGRTGGIYQADISEYVIAIGLGKEVETYIATETNSKNPEKTFFEGRYISLKEGNPTERWFAEMCNFTVEYEMLHYNAQCPLTVVNAPQFDPMYHSSEASFEEQNAWEERYGIPKFPFQKIGFENDVTELDVVKFTANSPFKAGLFACYHSYPHWPDFMWADEKYAYAKDKHGPNPFWGHLVELKKHHPDFPLLMGEYGVSTSWYPVYNTIDSVNQGGYTDQEQAEIMVRWSQNLFDANYAGAVVFEFQDEWWHTSVNLSTFMNPPNKPLWFNVLDGESNYGVETYHAPYPIPLLRGKKKDWEKAEKLTSSSLFKKHEPGDLKRIYAFSDFAFLYLRLDVKPWKSEEWGNREYWIALSTLPGKFGSQMLPIIDLKVESGVNFLIQLKENKTGEILVSENYNPHFWFKQPTIVGGDDLRRKDHLPQGLDRESAFTNILLPTQPYHIGRDGTIFPSLYSNWSELRYGIADPESPDYNNLAAWHVDEKNGMIEIRIPWMSMYVIDPPSRGVMSDLTPGGRDFGTPSETTPGIGVIAILYDPDKEKDEQLQTLPAADHNILEAENLPLYTWDKWVSKPLVDPALKQIYFDLQTLFEGLNLEREANP